MTSQLQNKTQPTDTPVLEFINALSDEQRKSDALQLCQLMGKISGKPPVMWGPSIIGFDKCHYKYPSGREGDMGAIGFSPRKTNTTLYLVDGVSKYSELLDMLGPHTTGKVCVYIKRLSDINLQVLEELIRASYTYAMAHKHNMHRAE